MEGARVRQPKPFKQRIGRPRKDSGFRMDGYWIWCGSAIRDDDGLFHMVASRIPKTFSFSPHWLTNSEIVHAVSENAEGPYSFSPEFFEAFSGQYIGLAKAASPYGPWERMDVPLLKSRPGHWDEFMATNPAPFVEADGTVLLGYKSALNPQVHGWPMILKYGLARADCPEGPYERSYG